MNQILISNEHPLMRKGLLQIILEHHPEAVIEIIPGKEALLQKIAATSYNLLICDIDVRFEKGQKTIQEIKSLYPHLYVLIISNQLEAYFALRALRAGADGYITKDAREDDFIKAISFALQGKKFIQMAVAEMLINVLDYTKRRPHERLSNREFEIFQMLAAGKTNSAIAGQLLLSSATVSTYRCRILEKMKVRSNADLVRYALENNLF